MSKFEGIHSGRMSMILWIVVFVLILSLTIGLIVSFTRIEDAIPTRTVPDSAYEIGLLDPAEGDYVQGTTSIYLKKAIDVDGLKCKPTNTASIEYQVFFYDSEGEFISATSVMSDKVFSTEFDTIPEDAASARIMITPLHDYEVSDKEIATYADMLTVTYNK